MRKAAEDWLANGLSGRSPKTIRKNKDVLEPILAVIGTRKIRELDLADVDKALSTMAKSYSASVVVMGHNALTRTIRYAQARGFVAQNVATLADTPKGTKGRPSKSITPDEVTALLQATVGTWMHAYVALCVGTGIRTEEARALRWENVDLDGDPGAGSPPSVQVWRSVRATGDVTTEKSRRTLALPQVAVDGVRAHRDRRGSNGLVFATRNGGELDAANVRRKFRKACKAAELDACWTPRELRHTGVSLAVLTRGAETLDRLLGEARSTITARRST